MHFCKPPFLWNSLENREEIPKLCFSDYSSTLDTGNVEVLVIDKPESATISPRLLELRKKIYDEEYLDNAIQRIAQVISGKLVENSEELVLRQ